MNEVQFNPPLKLYIVVNSEGKYFKSVGYNYSGKGGAGNWVEDINKCKVYLKIGQARSRVTFFATNYTDYPQPEILEITAGVAVQLDEKGRVEKALEKKKKAEAEREKRIATGRLEAAQRDLDRAKNNLNKLQNKEF